MRKQHLRVRALLSYFQEIGCGLAALGRSLRRWVLATCLAEPIYRALEADRGFGQTDGRTELHHCLVMIARYAGSSGAPRLIAACAFARPYRGGERDPLIGVPPSQPLAGGTWCFNSRRVYGHQPLRLFAKEGASC